MKQKVIVFASGTAQGGGSGFENLVNHSRGGELDADIVAVVSNHERGGVHERADRLGVPFVYMKDFDALSYKKVVVDFGAEWIALSGWLRKVVGLDSARTFNIHPALLSFQNGRFGGPGLFGHHVHDAVKAALDAGEIAESGPTMHFVTDAYDRGPIFFEKRIPLVPGMSTDDIAHAVNAVEHEWQPKITNLVVHEEIAWDGKDPASLKVPGGYTHLLNARSSG